MNKLALYITIVFMVSACTTGYVANEQELQAYVLDEDNGLVRKREVNGYDLQLTYRPVDMLILQETGGATKVKASELQRLLDKYKGQYYFILSLSRGDKEALYKMGSDYAHFSEMVQKLSFGMHEHINLTTSEKDTVAIADYVFPRTYGMGSATSLMFAFSKEKVKDDKWLQFNLSEFGMGLGRQNFRFDIDDLNNVPSVQYDIVGEPKEDKP